ncbi:CHAT domain-containing protein [Streptomyces massasporeus]|uniref:CHAT domain-containing protein n=1 Tax=Streptomyces massasporeus TaxID=67324 RepID=UPI0033C8BFAA
MGQDARMSVESRLRWFHTDGDPAHLLSDKAQADASALAEMLRSDQDLRCHFTLGLFHWFRSRLLAGQPEHDDQDDQKALEERAKAEDLLLPCYVVGRSDIPAPLVPLLAERSLRFFTERLAETIGGSAGPPPSAWVSAWSRSLREAPSGPREEVIAGVLPSGGVYSPEQVDLLIDMTRAIVATTPPGHGDRARRLDALANVLFARFLAEDAEADLKAAYEASRLSQQITASDDPPAPELTGRRRMMEQLHLRRTARLPELDEAIAEARRALSDAGVADRRAPLRALAIALDSRYRRTGSAADLQDAVDAFDELVRNAPADHPEILRREEILQLVDVVSELYQLHGRRSDLDKSIDTLTLLLHTVPGTGLSFCSVVGNLVDKLTTRFEVTGRRDDIDAAVALLEESRHRPSASAAEIAWMLQLQGRILELREERLSAPADLDVAIDLYRQASVAATPRTSVPPVSPVSDQSVRLTTLAYLSSALRKRAQRSRSVRDIDAAVAASHQSVEEAPPGHPLLASLQTNLAASHNARYHLTGQVTDLDTEIEINRQLKHSARPEDPEYPLYFLRLGKALAFRFTATDDASDVNEAIDVLCTGLERADDDSPHVAILEDALRDTYRVRQRVSQDWRDLEAAAGATKAQPRIPPSHDLPPREMLSYYVDQEGGVVRFEHRGWNGGLMPLMIKVREVLDGIPAESREWPYAQRLKQLLSEPPETLGGMPGVKKALDDYGAALLPITVPQAAAGGLDFGGFLKELRAQCGDPATRPYGVLRLQSAVNFYEEMLQNPEAVGRPYSFLALAFAKRVQYERSGRLPELEASLSAVRSAIEATPKEGRERMAYLWFAAESLQERFERTEEPEDLKGVIDSLRDLVSMLPPTGRSPGRVHFHLACAQRLAFEHRQIEQDHAEALRSLEQAQACLASGDPERDLYQALSACWTHGGLDPTGPLGVLDALITAYRAVLGAIPDQDPDWVTFQSHLSELLRLRHARTGDRRCLDQAVQVLQRIVDVMAVPGASRAADLTRLAGLLLLRHREAGDDADRAVAIDAYVRASEYPTAAPAARIHAARAAAELLAPGNPSEAARVLGTAVRLLPDTAPRQRGRELQQTALAAFPGLVADAVALTLAAAEADGPELPAFRALTLLESGRAVLIGQALEVRGDVALLQHHHPGLARRLLDLRSALQLPDTHWEREEERDPDPTAVASRHARYLAEKLTDILKQIRQQSGFASFAMPPTLDSLTAQAAQGPVVVYNISAYRSDAVLITEDGITNLELPALSPSAVRHQLLAFQQALRQTADAQSGPLQRRDAQDRLRAGLAWLWDNATGPVLYRLGIDSAHRASKPWPRVWWVPGGLLGQLPLHAAGHHDDDPDAVDRRTVMDRVVSSYSPSVRALDYSRARSSYHRRRPDKALVVSMPTTPGMDAPLAYAGPEGDLLKTLFPASLHLPTATSAQVMTHMADYPLVHFACHALCHPTDPSQSTLLLADHMDVPMTVRRLNTLTLEQGQLAFLSACSTAATAANSLLDEAIHLTSAFQLAGFPHVIGTLWEVSDSAALRVASSFYSHLAESETGPGDAALALHKALREQRARYPRLVSTWAAHLHTGT